MPGELLRELQGDAGETRFGVCRTWVIGLCHPRRRPHCDSGLGFCLSGQAGRYKQRPNVSSVPAAPLPGIWALPASSLFCIVSYARNTFALPQPCGPGADCIPNSLTADQSWKVLPIPDMKNRGSEKRGLARSQGSETLSVIPYWGAICPCPPAA